MLHVKLLKNGDLDKYKSRVEVKGFLQIKGVDYFDTFSFVVKSTIVRVVLTIALSKGLKMKQLDVNSAYLNGDHSEDVYKI